MPLIDIAVAHDDGKVEIVNGGRPSALIAFSEKFGHDEPRTFPEMAWLAHKASRTVVPFDKWKNQLAELDPREETVRRARIAIRDGVPLTDVPVEPDADPFDEARLVSLAGWLATRWGATVGGEALADDVRAFIVNAGAERETPVEDPTVEQGGGTG